MAAFRSTKPITLAGFTIIFMTFGVFGGWATVAKLDSAVVAPGIVALQGNRKTIQHLEGGIVEDILVDILGPVIDRQLVRQLRPFFASGICLHIFGGGSRFTLGSRFFLRGICRGLRHRTTGRAASTGDNYQHQQNNQ